MHWECPLKKGSPMIEVFAYLTITGGFIFAPLALVIRSIPINR